MKALGQQPLHDSEEALLALLQPSVSETRRINSLMSTVKRLQQAIDSLVSSTGLPYSRLHLFGFSQGGTVVLELARQHSTSNIRLGR